MNKQNLKDFKRIDISKNNETSLIRINEKLKDKVRLQAMINKVTMKKSPHSKVVLPFFDRFSRINSSYFICRDAITILINKT